MSFLEYLVNQEKSKRITKKDALDMKMNYLTLNHKDKKELDSQYSNEKKPVIPKGEKIISKNNNEKKPVIPKGEKIISKNNWMGAYGVETGPDVSENWYLTYNGPAPPVSEVHGKNYGVNIGNGVIPIRFYDEKWGVPKKTNETLIVEDLSQNESPIEVNTINEELLVNFMKSIRPSNYELIFDTYYVFLKNKFSPNKEVDDKIKLAAKKQLRGGEAEIFYKEYINRKVKENSNYDSQIDSEIKQKVLHPKKKRIKKNTAGEKIIEVDYDKFKQITTSRTQTSGTNSVTGRLYFGVMVWRIENYSLQLGLRHIKGPKIESILIDYDLFGADWVFLRNGQISFVIDNENFDFPANETKTDVGSYYRDWISEFGYYEISQIFLKKLCDSKSLDPNWSSNNWTSFFDLGVTFSSNCNYPIGCSVVNCNDTVIYDTTNIFVADAQFQIISPHTYLVSSDTFPRPNYPNCDSILTNYRNYIYNPNYFTDTNYVSISVTDTLYIDITVTGVPNVDNIISVYPNPANDVVIIDNGNYNNMSNYSLVIINSLSQQVFSSQINTQQFQIPVSTLGAEGTYFIQIFDGNNNLVVTKYLVLN